MSMSNTRESNSGDNTIRVTVIRETAVTPMSDRKREVCWDFGVPPRETPFEIVRDLEIDAGPGRIVLITGPSGSGKSSVLEAIVEKAASSLSVSAIRFGRTKSLIDSIAPHRPIAMAMNILTACGLGEPRLWIRRFQDLSEGERFRASLAKAIGAAVVRDDRPVIVCDEFTAILHRRAAKSIAYNLRKLVDRYQLCLVAATTHDDIFRDLQPNQHIDLSRVPPADTSQSIGRRIMSMRSGLAVERGTVRDYRDFSSMHYRHRDGLGFVDKVFLLRESKAGDPLGILVFAHAPMELTLRNQATKGRFVRNLRRLNRELRILRRLVMHPDIRGCGLGHYFVAKTLPQVGVRFVECLAAMGSVNPVFERAGMEKVGQCALPKGRLQLLERMKKAGVDPFAPDFHSRIRRFPRVRAMVESTINHWVEAQYGESRYQVAKKTPKQLSETFRQCLGRPPMYYLWDRDGEFPKQNDPRNTTGLRRRGADTGRPSREQEVKRHRPDASPRSERGNRKAPRR